MPDDENTVLDLMHPIFRIEVKKKSGEALVITPDGTVIREDGEGKQITAREGPVDERPSTQEGAREAGDGEAPEGEEALRTIRGILLDPEGHILDNFPFRLVCPDGTELEGESDGGGEFHFDNMPQGHYRAIIKKDMHKDENGKWVSTGDEEYSLGFD